jgi:hypothetical protein
LPWSPLLDHLLLGLVLDLGELDVLMMMPFSQVDVVAVHVDFLHILEDLLHVLSHPEISNFRM